jgi:hypothetical protein
VRGSRAANGTRDEGEDARARLSPPKSWKGSESRPWVLTSAIEELAKAIDFQDQSKSDGEEILRNRLLDCSACFGGSVGLGL